MEKNCLDIETYKIRVNERTDLTLPEQSYYIILVVNTNPVLPEWRNQLCEQIVHSRLCIQAMVTGHECSIWDDVLDETYVAFYNNEPPIDTCFMTTWHENESLDEVIEFAKIGMQLESISKLVIVQIE